MNKNMVYYSTRGGDGPVTASEAVLKGLAKDGGLFVPSWIPCFESSIEEMSKMDYRELAYEVMRLYLTDYTEEELKACIDGAYDDKFDTEEIVPLAKVGSEYYLELFHGSTIAFKDMALSILPHLMVTAARKQGLDKEIVILTATSGDTGKAALAGFAGVPGTRIMVYYPEDGVSEIQKLQMITQKESNTCVTSIKGNFDDAQSGVKRLFANETLREDAAAAGFQFSSANSINIGRLVPQIVYYVYAYTRLVAAGEIEDGQEVNVTVPTGNFGNILAAWLAKEMGLPIKKLVCASNENKVLTDFFRSGNYDRRRSFILTSSPSMDILISSNLERLLYWLCGSDAEQTAKMMNQLTMLGSYQITDEMRRSIPEFYADFATEAEVTETISACADKYGYVMDPHTAVAAAVSHKYQAQTGDVTPMLIASTASPYKFPASVLNAVGEQTGDADWKIMMNKLCAVSGVVIPRAVTDLYEAPICHRNNCAPEEMEATVRAFLGL
ncbi:MAG: threonine synthase [Lachnospiraceae bacterium]|nr:threonine synthase [Lachnospiraceae bacterium]